MAANRIGKCGVQKSSQMKPQRLHPAAASDSAITKATRTTITQIMPTFWGWNLSPRIWRAKPKTTQEAHSWEAFEVIRKLGLMVQ